MNIQNLIGEVPAHKFKVGDIVQRRPTRSENDGKRGKVTHIKIIYGDVSYLVEWEQPCQWLFTAEGDLVKVG